MALHPGRIRSAGVRVFQMHNRRLGSGEFFPAAWAPGHSLRDEKDDTAKLAAPPTTLRATLPIAQSPLRHTANRWAGTDSLGETGEK